MSLLLLAFAALTLAALVSALTAHLLFLFLKKLAITKTTRTLHLPPRTPTLWAHAARGGERAVQALLAIRDSHK